ncbi:glycosyltransferase family 87 protein [uncultured Roseibium sp.]|uniref:glycosyltransferase family 87 protein n=1 Tax=uncultured Roseibium sp. TaxID=1936171 RepID=UPI002631359E|nr:glycosyltransferase family 87 protein [uncultured Roseibium sp.]
MVSAAFNTISSACTGLLKVRARLLDLLRADDLNNRFGGPVFVFVLIAVSIFLGSSWYQNDWGGLFDFHSNLSDVQREDFVAFYRAGEMALQGRAAEAYDPVLFSAPFSEKNENLLFLNPPHALLIFEPLALLSYPAAKLVGMTVFFASFFGMIYMIRPNLAAWPYLFMLLSPGAFYAFQLLQLSPLITFLLLFAMLHSRDKPFLSGMALALVTIKPQYGLLLPVFLFAARDWRTFFYATIGTIGLLALSVAIYGAGLWEAFLTSMQDGAHSIQFSANHGMMSTVGSSFGKWGVSPEMRLATQLLSIAFAAVVVWFAARRLPRIRAVAVSMLAVTLASPSFMYYDWLFYSIALLIVLKEVPRWPLTLQATAALLWISPTIHDVLSARDWLTSMIFSSLVPLIALVVLCQVWVLLSREARSRPGHSQGDGTRMHAAS